MTDSITRPDPAKLLEVFVSSQRCEEAFAKLVESLNGLVYSSALRRTGDAQLAEEVAQNVFAIMARKAGSLRRHPCLTAWALKTTRLQSANATRSERRRRRKIAALASETKSRNPVTPNPMDDQPAWKDAVPHLDEALDRLPPEDQKLILQRFYEEKKFKEIASQNGQTESACKKRVQRALQKVSSLLTARGVSLSGTAVASLLGAEMARSAPLQATAAIAPKALAASSSLPTTTLVANTVQTMSTLKTTTITTAAILALAAIPISQQLAEGKRLRSDLQAIEQTGGSQANGGSLTALTGKKRQDDAAQGWSPRTATSLLDELAAPRDYRALVKQLMTALDPKQAEEEPWAATIAFARLTSLNEAEFASFLNAFDDYPAPAHLKRLAKHLMRLAHPGTVESHQDTLDRMMRSGREGNLINSMNIWVREDPDAALAWYREKSASGEIMGRGLETKFEKKTFESLVTTLAESRPREALEMFLARPQELRSPDLVDDVTTSLAKAMIETADDTHIRRMMEHHDRSRVLQLALNEYAFSLKFGDGVAFIEQFVTDPEQRADYMVQGVKEQEGVGRQAAALDWVRENTPDAEAPELFRRLGANAGINSWLKKQKPGVARDFAYLGSADRSIEADEFPAALSRVDNIDDEELRIAARERVGREWLLHDEAEATQRLPQTLLDRIQNQ